MTKSRAEELLEEGLRTRLLLIDANPDDPQTLNSVEHIIDMCQQALNLGLNGRDDVLCHVLLGSALWEKMSIQGGQELAAVIDSGISSAPNVIRIVTEFETAIKRDAEIGGEFFGDPVNRGAYLTDIEVLWLMQSRYLRGSEGKNKAISYLEERISSLDYLQGTFLPAISLELSELMEERDEEAASRWLQRACNAEVSDLDSDSISATSKRIAQNKLAQLSRPPENINKGGCFIATAVYGSDEVAEVRFLRTFRDEILLETHCGRLFVSFYYSFSPYAATLISKSEYLKRLIKTFVLNPILRLIRLTMR